MEEQESTAAKAASAGTGIARSAAKGAALGGGAPGAVVGAGKAAGELVLRNPRSRRALLVTVASVLLLPALVAVLLLTSVASGVSAVNTQIEGLGTQAIAAAGTAGMSEAELRAVISASREVGVPWPVVASVVAAQEYAVGGSGPFHATDAATGAPKERTDPQAYLWLARAVLQASRSVPGLDPTDDIGAYADRSSDGQLTLSDRHQVAVKGPWVAALSTLPLQGVDQVWAGTVMDRAVAWRMGVAGPTAGGCLPIASTPPAGTAPEPITLDLKQVKVAQTIAERVKASGLGQQALVIAYMTALVEARLSNPDHGDRDSLGAFQQRPSAGWGTREQIMDVALSTDAFLGVAKHTSNPGLSDITGWPAMPPGEAAQAVQRSAFPDAYTRWEAAARWLADTYGAGTEGSVDTSCPWLAGGGELGDCPETLGAIETQLQPLAIHMGRCVKSAFPGLFDPIGGWRPCDTIAPDHPSGLAIDAMVPNYSDPARIAATTRAAEWIMTNSQALGVRYLIWRQRKWNIEIDQPMPWSQWRVMEDRGSDTQNHFDHIHATVYGSERAGWQCW